jgi:hypothetical protein
MTVFSILSVELIFVALCMTKVVLVHMLRGRLQALSDLFPLFFFS